jgi:hypothetical protein
MDFLTGLILGVILAKSGADVVLWKWISQTWETFKKDK